MSSRPMPREVLEGTKCQNIMDLPDHWEVEEGKGIRTR